MGVTKILTAVAVFGVMVVAPQTAASAAGCARLVSAYQDGASNYARVKNVCSSSISARPTVPTWPDPSCRTIRAGATETFRTGGSLSPKATGAVTC